MSKDENYKPWIETRKDPNTLPKNKLLSRQLHIDREPTLTTHTAGQDIVWEISIREAAKDSELLREMLKSDKYVIEWIYHNDYDVDNYHYKVEESQPNLT